MKENEESNSQTNEIGFQAASLVIKLKVVGHTI